MAKPIHKNTYITPETNPIQAKSEHIKTNGTQRGESTQSHDHVATVPISANFNVMKINVRTPQNQLPPLIYTLTFLSFMISPLIKTSKCQ